MGNLYPANSDIVMCAQRDPVTATGSAVAYATAGTTYDYLNTNQYSRIRQNGTITQIRTYVIDKTNLVNFKFKIWRQTAANSWTLVGSQTFLAAALTAGQINTLTISPGIVAQEGDFIGLSVTAGAGGNASPFTNYSSDQTNALYYSSTEQNSPVNWAALSEAQIVWPCDVLMQAPVMVMIGDSTTGGSPLHYAFTDKNVDTNPPPTDITKSYPYLLGHSLGVTYQNVGERYSRTALCAGRITNHVVNIKPRYCVIMMGLTDCATLPTPITVEEFTTNYNTVLTACQNAGIIPIIIKVLPCSELTTDQDNLRKSYNTALNTIVTGYRDYLLLSYETEFTGGTVDSLCHPDLAGYTLLATLLSRDIGNSKYASQLKSTNPNFPLMPTIPME